MKTTLYVITVVLLGSMAFCKTKKITTGNSSAMAQQAVIYKTKADYSKNVPVTLSADKKNIIAYPAPKDVYYKDKLAYPTQLEGGYLLDNRGITVNSAFTGFTYEQYAKFAEAPPLKELMYMISDKDPITEIYNLGDRNNFKDEVAEINAIIKKGDLKKFTKVK